MYNYSVMSQQGDSPCSLATVAEAEEFFNNQLALGYRAARRVGDGQCELVRSFDPTLTDLLFFPQLVGG